MTYLSTLSEAARFFPNLRVFLAFLLLPASAWPDFSIAAWLQMATIRQVLRSRCSHQVLKDLKPACDPVPSRGSLGARLLLGLRPRFGHSFIQSTRLFIESDRLNSELDSGSSIDSSLSLRSSSAAHACELSHAELCKASEAELRAT